MGEIALDMDLIHTRIVLSVYQEYAFKILFPLYKVCQGFTRKVISAEVKQLAEEERDSISDKSLGTLLNSHLSHFFFVYDY